ncbi:hypothetical protein MG290_01515 [Flavobacterium sp. CBA20B-1]|uniref:hypothetical protein n=1 Tax=unclassified Flavobacterium TaxID=196869 RepID=UPI0022248350|nr:MULTISPECIES: hypothetical protein [unclassified Flavobacterium]WCM42374.1 hypothetical protein MG290_01515 [Flavobacterium sp. CBA20B-1]
MLQIINQIFEIEKKSNDQNISLFERNFERIHHELQEMGYTISNPIGKHYDARDTSVEANIVGNAANPIITKVLKPAIFQNDGTETVLLQKGIVIAE